jgi:hypothetical protein
MNATPPSKTPKRKTPLRGTVYSDAESILTGLLEHEHAQYCQECGIGHSDVWAAAKAFMAGKMRCNARTTEQGLGDLRCTLLLGHPEEDGHQWGPS